ncbi:TPR end-of-group domain-containing protein [Leptospira weilii]|uniref:Tetratricopeptide repeat protein n=1 Tax=Leptospira weilii str. UI 13098 TaxID=1088542 RepID=M6QI79_9LEPT|nr:hypothetical protein [Leptospira weilii]EMN92233.1 tetratricopeptide repeat protein [Leptospira weilii str. UI 13098]
MEHEEQSAINDRIEAMGYKIDEAISAEDYATARSLTEETIHLSAPCPGWLRGRIIRKMATIELDSGNILLSIEYLRKAIQAFPKYPDAWYQMALLNAKLENKQEALQALANAIEFGQSQALVDYRRPASKEADFAAFKSDPEFQALVDTGLPENPALNRVFEYLAMSEPMKAIKSGKKNLNEIDDLYAAYSAFEYAAEMIVRDLEEHGRYNLREYGLKSISEASEMLNEFKNELANRTGEKTETFTKFIAKRDSRKK